MGSGSYSTNNRVNAVAAAQAAARAEALAEEETVSLASPFEAEDPFVSTVDQEEKRPTLESAVAPTLADVPEYSTFEESLNNLPAFVEQQIGQGNALSASAIESGDYSDIKNEDINELRQDPSNVRDYYTESVDTNIVNFVEDNEIPLFKEVDGYKLYLNTGTRGSLVGIAKEGSDVVYQSYGPVGTYSTIAVPKDRSIAAAFPRPLRIALAIFSGGVSEAVLSAANALAGRTLTTEDWFNLAAGASQLPSTSPSTSSGGIFGGTTAPRTLAEMAEAGDIISLGLEGSSTVGALSNIYNDLTDEEAARAAAAEAATVIAELIERDAEEAEAQTEEAAAVAEAQAEAERLAEEVAQAEEVDTSVTDPVTGEEVIATQPEQVQTEQELPAGPEDEQEPIVVDPFESDIDQPELEEPTETEAEEEEGDTGGGGGGGASEAQAAAQAEAAAEAQLSEEEQAAVEAQAAAIAEAAAAQVEAASIIQGQREVQPGEYAYLLDDNYKPVYFYRDDNRVWIKNEELSGKELNEIMFCNLKNSCISIKKKCGPIEINKKQIIFKKTLSTSLYSFHVIIIFKNIMMN